MGEKTLHIFIAQVDPDAIGAAFGLAHIVDMLRAETDIEAGVQILYGGEIGHPQNRTIINKYDLKRRIKPITEELLESLDLNNNVIAIVDSSSISDARLSESTNIHPQIVIDHHRDSDITELKDTFVWIEDVGSASTMITELLQELNVEFEESAHVPMLLTLGIYTDTKKLVSASLRDRNAYSFVAKSISQVEYAQLINYPLPDSHFENLSCAIQRRKQATSQVLTNIGLVTPEERDDLSTIADYLLRMDGVSLVVVWGIVDKTVHISARSTDITTPLDEFLRKRFGPSSGAKFMSDGHSEGGARIKLDLGFWLSEATQDAVEEMVSRRLEELMFNGQAVAIPVEQDTEQNITEPE